jgi:hypothetical protein
MIPEASVASEPEFQIPDITSRAIGPDVLSAMLPGEPATTVRSNEELVMAAVLDRSDQADDIVAHGRTTGILGEYAKDTGTAYVWIDVLPDTEAAHDYLVDVTGDIVKGVDGTHQPSALLTDAAEFAVSAGEEAVGLVGTLTDGATETLVVSRVGRLVLFSSQVRADTSDARVAVQYLVDDTIKGIVETLTGDQIELSAIAIPAYRFQTTIDVSQGTQRWVTEASGTINGDAVKCTLDRALPDGRSAAQVVAVDDRRWIEAPPASGFVEVGSSTLAAEMLVWCPSWPLNRSAIGLDRIEPVADPPRHHVNGVDATGYQGDAIDLGAAFGLDPSVVDVDTFSFWVVDGSDWVVELALIVTGPADALLPIIGSSFAGSDQVSVSLRHRVFDINSVDTVVPPN